MARGVPSYSSSLTKIDGNSFVITNYIAGNAEYYRFYCFNDHNTRTISGRIVFDQADKAKAKAILNRILNGIKFKD